MTVPLAAIAPHITLPPVDPEAPGPLAFGSEARVRRVLGGAGFVDVALEAYDESMLLGGAENLDEVMAFMTKIGPAARALRDAPPDAAARATDAMREAFRPYAGPDGVLMGGSTWIVTARVP
jgi:hypothetical protein